MQPETSTKIVKLIKVQPLRVNLARITTATLEGNKPVLFEAWDNKYQYILRKCRPGDTLIIDSYKYCWPNTTKSVNKIAKVTNYSSNYIGNVVITNTNNTRAKKEKYQLAFCGKDDNFKKVIYFYMNKSLNLENYIINGKKCRISGTEMKSGSTEKHKRINVEQLYWI